MLAHAVIVAWMVGLRVSAVLYVVPVLVLLAGSRGVRAACLAGVLGVAASFVVFTWAPLSLPAYVAVLEKTARHGFDPQGAAQQPDRKIQRDIAFVQRRGNEAICQRGKADQASRHKAVRNSL